MCRSIKTLRPPFTDDVTDADIEAAGLQYVRKVSGFRTPAAHNAEVFDAAVVRSRPPPRSYSRSYMSAGGDRSSYQSVTVILRLLSPPAVRVSPTWG